MARKFLYFIAFCTVLVVAGGIAFKYWGTEAAKLAFVPSSPFVEQAKLREGAYADAKMWYVRPDLIYKTGNPARWQPKSDSGGNQLGADSGYAVPLQDSMASTDLLPTERQNYAVFFVHPTSYLSRASWNAPLDDADANGRARLFISAMASPFGEARDIWAPRYRQATIGAFLTDEPDGETAIRAAYADVLQAFRYFIAHTDKSQPIVLVGHSQGALHLMHILQQEVAGTDLSERIAVAYLVGWPISVDNDLARTGLPGCGTPAQSGCVMSWSSYAEPADPEDMIAKYRESTGLDGNLRGDSAILCTNPLTGSIGGSAPASANLGTLVPNDALDDGVLRRAMVPARCDQRGLLLIGPPPEMGDAVLPGNNYHVYDIPLFWANVRADVATRVAEWQHSRS